MFLVRHSDLTGTFILEICMNIVKKASVFGSLFALGLFAMVTPEAKTAFYFEDAKEIFIQNNKIYLRHSNDKLIKILDEQTGFLLKNIEINLDNCFLQVNKLSKIVVINRLKKKLIVFDEYGKLVCENELINIQNVSSFCITSENFYIINDFPSKMTYVF